MKIFLIGFMGAGKTTLGGRLAIKLGYPFIDLDKLIVEKTGQTIAEYFDAFGEKAFRKFERDTLQADFFPNDCVIATGGGAPCFYDNINWMNEAGITVYLSLSPKALAARLEKGKHKRPLIRDLSQEELITYIEERLQEREKFYNQAKITVKGIDFTAEKVLEEVDAYLK